MALYDRNDSEPLDPAAERLRRKMTRLLMVSGGIMVLGFIAVFAALVYKLGLLGDAAAIGAGAPVEAAFPLPQGARIVSSSLDGDRALLHIEAADGAATLILVDLASGEVLGRYTARPE